MTARRPRRSFSQTVDDTMSALVGPADIGPYNEVRKDPRAAEEPDRPDEPGAQARPPAVPPEPSVPPTIRVIPVD